MNRPTLSIIIPVYNEETRLERCIEMLTHWLRVQSLAYEIIIVDNGSTDATLRICSELQRFNSHIQFDALGVRGKGRAVAHGMLTATGDYRYMCDVDLSTPPFEIERFLVVARGADVVIGSRELDPAHVLTTAKRRMMGRAFHAFANVLVPGIEDTQCGFKMFTAKAARDIFERMRTTGMAFDVEALWLARQLGYSIAEIPVTWRQDEQSRVRMWRDSLEMLGDVINVPWRHPELGRSLARV